MFYLIFCLHLEEDLQPSKTHLKKTPLSTHKAFSNQNTTTVKYPDTIHEHLLLQPHSLDCLRLLLAMSDATITWRMAGGFSTETETDNMILYHAQLSSHIVVFYYYVIAFEFVGPLKRALWKFSRA